MKLSEQYLQKICAYLGDENWRRARKHEVETYGQICKLEGAYQFWLNIFGIVLELENKTYTNMVKANIAECERRLAEIAETEKLNHLIT